MLTKLICESQWYNPVVGFPKFYLSAEGGDVNPATKVDCSFSVVNGTTVVTTAKVEGVELSPSPDRGGSTWRCTTKAIENLPTNIPLKMLTTITDDQNKTASCTGIVTLRP